MKAKTAIYSLLITFLIIIIAISVFLLKPELFSITLGILYHPSNEKVIRLAALPEGNYCALDERIKNWGNKEAEKIIDLNLLNDKNKSVINTSVYIIGKKIKYKKAIPLLVEQLNNEKISDYTLITALASYPKEIYPHLIKHINSESPIVRRRVCETLGYIRNKESYDLLVNKLSDPVPTVRGVAALALGRIGDEKVVEILANLLESDMNEDVRFGCVGGLGNIKHEKSSHALVKALKDPRNSEQLKQNCSDYLWHNEAVECLDELQELAKTEKNNKLGRLAESTISAILNSGRYSELQKEKKKKDIDKNNIEKTQVRGEDKGK